MQGCELFQERPRLRSHGLGEKEILQSSLNSQSMGSRCGQAVLGRKRRLGIGLLMCKWHGAAPPPPIVLSALRYALESRSANIQSILNSGCTLQTCRWDESAGAARGSHNADDGHGPRLPPPSRASHRPGPPPHDAQPTPHAAHRRRPQPWGRQPPPHATAACSEPRSCATERSKGRSAAREVERHDVWRGAVRQETCNSFDAIHWLAILWKENADLPVQWGWWSACLQEGRGVQTIWCGVKGVLVS